jgi:hypothetical protein
MNQDETFIGDRESSSMEWITLDEVCRKTKTERQEIAKKIWENNKERGN